MYLTPTKDHWGCDIEADGLLEEATTIWCCTVCNIQTKDERTFYSAEEFRKFREEFPDAIFVGHNFIAYDAVMLNRLWDGRIPISRIVDTFVLSQLYHPTFPRPKGMTGKKGPHSLEAWGIRLRYPKGEFEDFSKLSDEMVKYCRRDTRLTCLLFLKLSARMADIGFTERGCSIQHLAWNIIQNKQKRNGFPFNYKAAQELYLNLRAREEELKDVIYRLWPPERKVVAEFKQAYKKDGTETQNFRRHSEQYPEIRVNPDGSYTAYDDVAFNLGSPPQRIQKLLELGWKPTNLTKKGNPKVDEDELMAFAEVSGKEELKALAKWIVVNSRANMLFSVNQKGEETGWLTAYDKKTGSIHGRLFLASTLRYRHSNPNTANIPAVRLEKRIVDGKEVLGDDGKPIEDIQYGESGSWSYECRDLWNCGDPKVWDLVGIDGTGIQNRCLIHSLIKTVGPERVQPFKELALEGDVHKRNIEVLGLANKAAAKKFYYTLMMGGGGKRLAADQAQFGTKMSAREGEQKRKMMIDSIPGFGELIDALTEELERTGRIRLCDGSPVIVPSPHMVIPYLLQGDESMLMKQAMIYLDDIIRREKWDRYVLKAADIHDEWQYRSHVDVTAEFVEAALPCFPRAGESFDYLIRIDGDAKVGKTWAETH